MYKFIEAIYHKGSLILKEKLSKLLEGKQVTIIILDLSDNKKTFLKQADRHSFNLPHDYQFNREELYE